MEYVQEGIATLHDFGDASPSAPTDSATVVVPMTEREHAGLAAERVLSALEVVSPERVVVPLRASADRVEAVVEWLDGFDIPLSILWCDGPRLSELLSEADLNGTRGKGRDVWLALGIASDSEYVVVHDADAKSYDSRHVPKLLFPLARGKAFSKGYYARVENDRLYGRLFRLFYRPLLEAIEAERDAPILAYLGAFRYALAGSSPRPADSLDDSASNAAGDWRSERSARRFGWWVRTDRCRSISAYTNTITAPSRDPADSRTCPDRSGKRCFKRSKTAGSSRPTRPSKTGTVLPPSGSSMPTRSTPRSMDSSTIGATNWRRSIPTPMRSSDRNAIPDSQRGTQRRSTRETWPTRRLKTSTT